MKALEEAAGCISDARGIEELAIGLSATAQEIVRGALSLPQEEARAHVHAFVRQIKNVPTDLRSADFLDLDAEGNVDQQRQSRLRELKTRLCTHLGPNVHEYQAEWHNEAIARDSLGRIGREGVFCDRVWHAIKGVVDSQVRGARRTSTVACEADVHRWFGDERCKGFLGREVVLRRIDAYLEQGTGQPLAVVGPSGSGKSALLGFGKGKASIKTGKE